ncbi:hypothetical protein BB560_001953 [Smittium megazygosporum]|uniref:Peptidase S1 domain-containing protein n=1 Tax=Smittium megazygosporum TaxID=133381 RepID=A0A2T9ZEY4_9FUNG|nr:hypothetical protein BB560_002367 [Smittium megazygosporum]PVV03165.1 hypothetical protein BB560_002369 [Smittium megazygosporum]PVV03582.1 hypothetical protein BB560_001953 [Smittium megazygosporum]
MVDAKTVSELRQNTLDSTLGSVNLLTTQKCNLVNPALVSFIANIENKTGDNSTYCSGALINNTTVITFGQCVQDQFGQEDPANISVYLSSNSLKLNVSKIETTNFANDSSSIYDITYLTLENEVTENEANPINIFGGQLKNNQRSWVAGFIEEQEDVMLNQIFSSAILITLNNTTSNVNGNTTANQGYITAKGKRRSLCQHVPGAPVLIFVNGTYDLIGLEAQALFFQRKTDHLEGDPIYKIARIYETEL